MLVLSRKQGERIMIGTTEIVVLHVDNRGGRVKLGFVSPTKEPVYRKEIWDQIQKAKPPEPKTGSSAPSHCLNPFCGGW